MRYTTADAANHLAQYRSENDGAVDLATRYDNLKAAVGAQRERQAHGLTHSLDALKGQWQALKAELIAAGVRIH